MKYVWSKGKNKVGQYKQQTKEQGVTKLRSTNRGWGAEKQGMVFPEYREIDNDGDWPEKEQKKKHCQKKC